MQDRHRRKSLSIFKPTLSGLAPIRDGDSPPPDGGRASVLKKKLRPTSFIAAPPSASSPLPIQRADSDASQQSAPSPALKGRPSSKPSRPSSIFGSIKSIHSLQSLPDDESSVGNSTCRTSWGTNGDAASTLDPECMVLLHHGDVTIGGGMFRKRSQYLVLTNTHLIRFRSQARASELFPGLTPPSSSSGSESNTHVRKPSNSSIAEISSEDASSIPVRQIVASYRLEDGKDNSKPSHSIEVAYLDESSCYASSLTLQLQDTKEADQWLKSLRETVAQTRANGGLPYSKRAIEYVARVLENDGDYDPQHFHMYTVVQREKKSGSRSSSDDLGRLLSSISYLVIGYYKMHLVPLLRPTKSSSSTSITDLTGSSYGIAALSSFSRSTTDDAFQLGFRLPLQASTSLYLASACSEDISESVKAALEYLRPIYVEQPLSWSPALNHSKPPSPTPAELEDHLGFDRTLTAYCIAYKLDPSNIRYTVNYYGEDTPGFQLLEPANAAVSRPNYTAFELLAIFRALRYNDSFVSLSFRGVKLDALHGLVDRFGCEHLCWKTKTGQALDRPHANRLSLLVQEIQNIAVQNERLRRVDFTEALSQSRADARYTERSSTEMVEALMPLCSQRLTNIDWIILNGMALSELDVSSLYSATLKRSCEFRAIELGGCALGFEGLRVVTEGMQYQAKTIECVNISGCATRLDEGFVAGLSAFKSLRQLDLSKCQPAVGGGVFLPYNVLNNWRLESLKLSGTPLNRASVDDLSAYLIDNQSSNLRELLLDSCQVNGREIAVLLQSLSTGREEARKMIMDVSKNRVAQDQYAKILTCIKASETPEHLIVRSLEYSREEDFKALLEAVGENKSLKYLDISSVSLPVDAGAETCETLKGMFEANDTLEELNMSGETAALEAATIGKGLPGALRGLASNKSLRVFHCRHQALGLPGAAALAYALEHNSTLHELHCEDNEISLQAFTALVNALESNETLLYMPTMHGDRKFMTDKVNREVNAILSSNVMAGSGAGSTSRPGGSFRRSVTGLTSYRPYSSLRSSSSRTLTKVNSADRVTAVNHSVHANSAAALAGAGYTEQDLAAAVTKLDDSWEAETERMQQYLLRNVCLAQGLAPDGSVLEDPSPSIEMKIPLTAAEAGFVLPPVAESSETSRPATAGSLAAAIAKASLDRTPTAEFDRQLVGPAKLAIDASIVEKGLSESGLGNENALLDTPVQEEFSSMLHPGEEGDAVLVMGAR